MLEVALSFIQQIKNLYRYEIRAGNRSQHKEFPEQNLKLDCNAQTRFLKRYEQQMCSKTIPCTQPIKSYENYGPLQDANASDQHKRHGSHTISHFQRLKCVGQPSQKGSGVVLTNGDE